MKLSVGKYYRCLDGRIVGPMELHRIARLSSYPYKPKNAHHPACYTEHGTILISGSDVWDIVEEVPESELLTLYGSLRDYEGFSEEQYGSDTLKFIVDATTGKPISAEVIEKGKTK